MARLLLALLLLCAPLAGGAGPAPAPPRVLACYWGLDRATDVTFLGFQKYVLNFFRADLCAAVTDKHRDGSGADDASLCSNPEGCGCRGTWLPVKFCTSA